LSPTQTRTRQSTRRRKPSRKRHFGWPARLTFAVAAAGFALLIAGAVARHVTRTANTTRASFDTIIVLGYPATSDGDPSARELASVDEAVSEYERGMAPHLIFTGSAVANQFVEAEVMAHAAEAQGIPPAAVFTETRARNTVENACYAVQMMKAHGWNSAEVIANPAHLRRAALIFTREPIEWRMQAAPRIEPESAQWNAAESLWEDAKAANYLVWERWTEHCTVP
jgi:uncharacterized SAM-binding protein YcdF (DUF218 family)